VKVSRILTRGRRQTGGLFGGVIPVTASGGEGVSDACAEPDHINDKANAAATLPLGISFFGVPFPATTTRDAEVSSPKHPSAPHAARARPVDGSRHGLPVFFVSVRHRRLVANRSLIRDTKSRERRLQVS